jgi:hypothetical protein
VTTTTSIRARVAAIRGEGVGSLLWELPSCGKRSLESFVRSTLRTIPAPFPRPGCSGNRLLTPFPVPLFLSDPSCWMIVTLRTQAQAYNNYRRVGRNRATAGHVATAGPSRWMDRLPPV